MGNKQLSIGILLGIIISGAFYAVFLKSPSEDASPSVTNPSPAVINSPSASVTSGVAASAAAPDRAPRSESASPSMVDQLFADGRSNLVLPTGSAFELAVNAVERNGGVEQIFATVDPNGQPGFGLITVKNQQVVGTFNTPEGVYEMFGTRDNVQIKRASEIDGPRRQGTDFMIRPGGTALSLPRDGKTIDIQIQ